jgi:hypothetical protein
MVVAIGNSLEVCIKTILKRMATIRKMQIVYDL